MAEEAREAERLYERHRAFAGRAPEVTAALLKEWLRGGEEVALVDVREPEERRVSMLAGAVPREEFRGAKAGAKVVAYCTIGVRSGRYAARLLRREGAEVYNLRGGILAGVAEGLPLVEGGSGRETKRVHALLNQLRAVPRGYEAVVLPRWRARRWLLSLALLASPLLAACLLPVRTPSAKRPSPP